MGSVLGALLSHGGRDAQFTLLLTNNGLLCLVLQAARRIRVLSLEGAEVQGHAVKLRSNPATMAMQLVAGAHRMAGSGLETELARLAGGRVPGAVAAGRGAAGGQR